MKIAACLLLGLAPLAVVAADDPPRRPLDDRVDPSRITESDLPPLRSQLVLPMPPEHRIAADAGDVPMDPERFAAARAALDRGAAWLRAHQDESGTWLPSAEAAPSDAPERPSPVATAITALAVKALSQIAGPDVREDEHIVRGLRVVLAARNADGGFDDGPLANYVTSSVVSALAASQVDEFSDHVAEGTTWLTGAQWDEGEGLAPRQDWYGGSGYGNHGRPDLSNTQMMLEALYDAGMSPEEPAFQRALAFISRTQNLSATNASAWSGDDGGFVYTSANGGESMASEAAGEGRRGERLPEGAPRSLRSYGSMTYAGFKSLLYAGLDPDDVRVRAAFDWIRNHWTFDENPGLGAQGLFYYYHAMSRALRVAQQDTIEDVEGAAHNWRDDLVDALLERQRPDGSWCNEADRWLEGEPVMATIYALLTLEETLKPVHAKITPAQP